MVSGYFRNWPTIIRRALYESALPFAGGGAWVVYAWYQKTSFFEALSGFGIGYLFVLSAQGQVLRIAKNVRDETDADEFRESFASLKQGIETLQRQATDRKAEESGQPPAALGRSFQNTLMEAYSALSSGQNYAAAVLAAIAFERSARNVAEIFNINTGWGLLVLITELSKEAPASTRQHLRTLVQLRNGLVHGRYQDMPVTKNQAEEVVKSFHEGLMELESIIDDSR